MAGIYIHVPFCTQRCVYCDFYFVTTAQVHEPFVESLKREIDHLSGHFRGESVGTIYLGGGTPSLLSPANVFGILDSVAQAFEVDDDCEITFELNPEDGSLDYLREIRRLGVNRLSIGVQSFFDADLRFMNRAHSAEESVNVVAAARAAGFENFSIDLIFGSPGQPVEYWGANLEKAHSLGIPHVSTYGLTIETKTPLANQIERGLVTPLAEDEMAERYTLTMDLLRSAGYEHYEISSFAKSGMRSRHNQAYWKHENYLGMGPSAHSFLFNRLPAQRWSNIRSLKRWHALLNQNQSPIEMRESIDLDNLANEYILLSLRTSDGLDLETLRNRYGVDLLDERMDDIAYLESESLINPFRNDTISLTDEGKLLCDVVTSKLILG